MRLREVLLSAALMAAAFTPSAILLQDKVKVSSVANGTHAPKAVLQVWRLHIKGNGTCTVFPVAKRENGEVVFLGAKHCSVIPGDKIVESQNKLRKIKVDRIVSHPALDLALFITVKPLAEVELIPLGLDIEREPGLSCFVAGYPGGQAPTNFWHCYRGYLGFDNRIGIYVRAGMSGGPVIVNKKVIGVVIGHAWDWSQPWNVYSKDGEVIGRMGFKHKLRNQGFYVPLDAAIPWLKANKVVE